ncbi:hypothetical protein S7335_2074 [Synechococcus sp. PCC 7335]|uniref:heterocyst differentiation protein HetZ n=1 Tax=Synechococcus sp. (strain ATCC 29403 / PCC 7335) TaxID=91464 RepID=UPI00017EC057|nr:heterocyst differentiation protein HetZ [Synechococcus sp. PCC 7335]EDX84377.1 hypothetical protein S7335_2074 [Synechococcus sp. PCC 7335]
MKTLFERLSEELSVKTNASIRHCYEVAKRIEKEARRICMESQRIQNSGDIEGWANNLAGIRLTQCLRYADLGSTKGRIELHSSLSAIIYRYITPPQVQASYQARILLIEDFLQNFYAESINAFRRENEVALTYRPRSLLELAEYMAYTERYAKRRIHLSKGRSQQLIILRAQTFSKKQPPETAVDIQQTIEGTETARPRTASSQRLREELLTDKSRFEEEETIREQVVDQLMNYLVAKGQCDCADYFALRLNDLPTHKIEDILQITSRERDYLQQRFKYHLLKFSFVHSWELVHEWLGIELCQNLGLTPYQWTHFRTEINSIQAEILTLKQKKHSDQEISNQLNITSTQLRKQWFNLLEKAWDIRNV